MSIFGAVPSATSEKSTGTHKVSSVTANVADGDTVALDGDVATDADGNVLAWVNIPGGTNVGNADSATAADEVTVNHDIGSPGDVTVVAIVE